MKLYKQDVHIYGTAYVKASNKARAQNKLAKMIEQYPALELIEVGTQMGIPISDRDFQDPDLPEVSLSPAMTITADVGGDMEEVTKL